MVKRFYKLKYKRSEEGAKAEEIIVTEVGEGSLIATLKVKAKRSLLSKKVLGF